MKRELFWLTLIMVMVSGLSTPIATSQAALPTLTYSPGQTFPYSTDLTVTRTSNPQFYSVPGAPCRNENGSEIVPCILATWAQAPKRGYAYREIVTRAGRLWEWNVSTTGKYEKVRHGVLLTAAAEYTTARWETGYGSGGITGPCAGLKGAACQVAELSFYTNSQGLLRQYVYTRQPLVLPLGVIQNRLYVYSQDVQSPKLVGYVSSGPLEGINPTGGGRPRP